jgi:ribosomal protein S18 acetylase RimI-like enzyme
MGADQLNVTFRLASPDDVPTIVNLQKQYYAEDGYAHDAALSASVIAGLIGAPERGWLWVIEEHGRPVGYMAVTFGYSLEYKGRDAFIDELYIVPPLRERGVGRAALRVADEACRQAGVRAIHLEVEPHKTEAVRLYRSSGFLDHRRHLMTKWLESG